MSAAQYVILSTLSQKGHVDAAAWFCKDMSYDSGAMTRVIDRLEAKGLIKRQPSVNDGRSVRLEMTEAARFALPTLRACALGVINQFLCDFCAEETKRSSAYWHECRKMRGSRAEAVRQIMLP